jgi:phosphomannomutase
MTSTVAGDSLISHLKYQPKELSFGTSGRRGEIVHLSQLEIYINALAELEYLQSLPRAQGGISRGEEFYLAYDLRPSSIRYEGEQPPRGEIAQAVECAIRDAGMQPVNLGCIPTPALTYYALSRGKGSMMVTGSHTPFDRNGYKTNTATGELLKDDEAPIGERVRQVRERIYNQPFVESMFDERGLFKAGHRELPPERHEARAAYIERYIDFFGDLSLAGVRLLVYQHSAAGRDLLVEVLERFGAEAAPAGRSDSFVPVDTENIDQVQLSTIQRLADEAAAGSGPVHGVVSTDGDSDRPLILGVNPETGGVQFFGGDLVGMIVAGYLGADAVVVPISCNDAIDRCPLAQVLEPKTRIGSPYVIAGMEAARRKGRQVICGWEANGGFLLGSDIQKDGRVLKALPTRDAVLPILCILFAAREAGLSLSELFARLPRRFSRASLLKQFPQPIGKEIVKRYSPSDWRIRAAVFGERGTLLLDDNERELPGVKPDEVESIRERLEEFFPPHKGFGRISRLNYIDGVRVTFSQGDIAHIRPSGNADELRIYTGADTEARAGSIAAMAVEPDGILRRMERAVIGESLREARETQCALLRLQGAVKHYEWGGYGFIPGLLRLENQQKKPFAELWIGTHPSGPATAQILGCSVPLDQLLEAAPEAILGEEAASRFAGRLPYLFKILDVRKMLSIQAHPDKRQAEEGFARENAAGIRLDAAHRNYKDDNHKPEIQVALTESWMLHGFRPWEEIAETFCRLPEFAPVAQDFSARLASPGHDSHSRREILRELYSSVLTKPQTQIDAALNALLARLEREAQLARESPDFWALRAAEGFPLPGGHRDRGILSLYLLNLVHLRPGQGIFQPPGVLHAYLEGVTVELMASSDNVLRGGLTPKHVDVMELMRTLSFDSGLPRILEGEPVSRAEKVYRTPAAEFELSRIELEPAASHARRSPCGPEMFFALSGPVLVTSGHQKIPLERGDSLLVPHGVPYVIEAAGHPGLLFKASLPETRG